MSDKQLIERVVSATTRAKLARIKVEEAENEERDASKELMEAWTALRAYQDKQVQKAMAEQNK